jgi:DNA-binding transcriptional ArsR family regulator
MRLDGPAYPAVMVRELGLSPSNISNHVACLRDYGIVVVAPQGRRTRYGIANPHLARPLAALVETTLAVDAGAACIDPGCGVEGCRPGDGR